MSRLFHRGEWFVELSPTALSETEFESLLIQNSTIVRAECRIVPFKKTVYADGESARADLAIIADDYREWVVVEVEMQRHDLHRHVVPQINTLRKGVYGQEHASYLASKCRDLDAAKISAMLRGEAPEVLVLVNKYDDEWGREIRRYGAHMMTFEIYRSEQSNKHIFAINGELPALSQDVLSELSFGLVPRCLSVKSPARLDFEPGERVSILVDGQMTFWERFDTANQCFVTPIGTMPIKQGRKYALVRMENQQYAITTIN